MPDAFTVTLSPQAEQLLQAFGNTDATLPRALMRAMDRANQLVIGAVSRARFTGRGPFPVGDHRLGVRTNRLRSSLRASKAVIDGNGGIASAIGSNVIYFGAHEYGFTGTASVRAHTRTRTFGKGGLIRASARGRKEVLSSTVSTVRAHSRKMKIPARAPLSTGIAENLGIYSRELSEAVIKTLTRNIES
jgi:hypothetical protein